MNYKIALLASAVAIATPAIVSPIVVQAAMPFKDVSMTQNPELYQAIDNLYSKNIVFGETAVTYNASRPLTRGEAAAFLAKAANLPVTNPNVNFKDISNSKYKQDIIALANAGVVNDVEKFNPEKTITRGQMAKMIVLTFELDVASRATAPISDFTNVDEADRYIQTLFDYGITAPGNTFRPYATVNRGHMALFMQRAITNLQLTYAEEVQPASTVAALTEEIAKQFKTYTTTIEVTYRGSFTDISDKLVTIYEQAVKQAPYQAAHLTGTSDISIEGRDGNIKMTINVQYLTDLQQEFTVETEINREVATIKAHYHTPIERIKAVNDYIVAKTEYSENTFASPHSAYALITENKAVCQGYALVAHQMLEKLGFETQYVTGYVNGNELHAWNLVKVDGQWYHLDTTWNDPTPNRQGVFTYNYFLVNDQQLAKDHVWDRNEFPQATSAKYHYFQDMQYIHTVGKQLYFSNAADNYRLYTMMMDGSHKRALTNERALYITGHQHKLYFSAYDNGGYLTMYDLNNAKTQVLLKQHATDLHVKQNTLHYKVNNKPHSLPIK